ncbi:MAG: serine hydrolase domain-containing protein [Polyangiaceae bacterium]
MSSTALAASLGAYGVPGAALALVLPGGVRVECAGCTGTGGGALVDEETVFEAASLSEPCFALAVLRLAEAGAFPLDEPLASFVEGLADTDDATRSITARQVLAHSSGLPNWRTEPHEFRSWFTPGSRFSYSGEGFVLLQKAVEVVCRKSAERIVAELVFEPVRMTRSSFVWHAGLDANHARAQAEEGMPAKPKWEPERANIATSLHTTAHDYGRFLSAVLTGELLDPRTAELWLQPATAVPERGPVSLGVPTPTHPDLAWGLGWGLRPGPGLFFQWGANPGFQAMAIGSTREQQAMVLLSNGSAGLHVAAAMITKSFPASARIFEWLGIR